MSAWRGRSMFDLLLERIAQGLERAAIPYMVIGGAVLMKNPQADLAMIRRNLAEFARALAEPLTPDHLRQRPARPSPYSPHLRSTSFRVSSDGRTVSG